MCQRALLGSVPAPRFPKSLLPSGLGATGCWEDWDALGSSGCGILKEFCALEPWSVQGWGLTLSLWGWHSSTALGDSLGLQLPVHLCTCSLGAGGAEMPRGATWEEAAPSWDSDPVRLGHPWAMALFAPVVPSRNVYKYLIKPGIF